VITPERFHDAPRSRLNGRRSRESAAPSTRLLPAFIEGWLTVLMLTTEGSTREISTKADESSTGTRAGRRDPTTAMQGCTNDDAD
jgi:hypothetical protein